MHVVIAGGSGFVGQVLQDQLLQAGCEVTILTRNLEKVQQTERLHAVQWLVPGSNPEQKLSAIDALINLAGESINGLRWTKAKKTRIIESRMAVTREMNRIIGQLERKPEVLINASAVGYYGMSKTRTFTESDTSTATDFLAEVVQDWETEAMKAEQYGVRTVVARLGIVLGNGGALPLMTLPYKLGAGGTIASGEQWVSWVHVEDVAGLIHFVLTHPDITGPVNVTAPEPLPMKEFGKTIAHVLRRPHWLPVPSFALKVLLGEMSAMLIDGQRVLPEKALQHKYLFKHPRLEHALQDLWDE